MTSTTTQVAELVPSKHTDIGRTDPQAPTASDTMDSSSPGPYRSSYQINRYGFKQSLGSKSCQYT